MLATASMRRARCARRPLIPGTKRDARVVDYFPSDRMLKSTRHEEPLFAQVEDPDILRTGNEKSFGDDLAQSGFQRAFINATVRPASGLLKPIPLSTGGHFHPACRRAPCEGRVEDRRSRVVVEVDRNERFLVVFEDAFQSFRKPGLAALLSPPPWSALCNEGPDRRSTRLIVGTRIA